MNARRAFAVGAVLALGAVAVLRSGDADAQSKNIPFGPSDVAVYSVGIDFLSDGGCNGTPRSVAAVNGYEIQVQHRPRQLGPAVCRQLAGVAQRAAYLDYNVGDGGQP